MRYLVDTDWIISFLNGKPEAVALIERLADEGIAISIITCGEIYEGLLGRPSAVERIREFREFTQTVDVLGPDMTVARRYADIRTNLRSRGLLIPDNDLWIAATALAHGLTLVSGDQHFPRVPSLKLLTVGTDAL